MRENRADPNILEETTLQMLAIGGARAVVIPPIPNDCYSHVGVKGTFVNTS